MRFYIVRHGAREEPDTFEDKVVGDPDAELTDQGQAQAAAIGAWMAAADEVPNVIIASPTVRTQQTAQAICDAIADEGMTPPDIKTDVGMGPHMSIRAAVMGAADDDSMSRVCIVSHGESIAAGLKVLADGGANKEDLQEFAMGELRILKVKRKTGEWKLKTRLLPSDLGQDDQYG